MLDRSGDVYSGELCRETFWPSGEGVKQYCSNGDYFNGPRRSSPYPRPRTHAVTRLLCSPSAGTWKDAQRVEGTMISSDRASTPYAFFSGRVGEGEFGPICVEGSATVRWLRSFAPSLLPPATCHLPPATFRR